MRRFVDLSMHHARVSQRLRQILIHTTEHQERIPAADLGAVVVGRRDVTITGGALGLLGEEGVPVVALDQRFLPSAVSLPVSGHHLVASRARAQLSTRKPLQKQLWATIVRAKIEAQAATVGGDARRDLLKMARQVRSGDTGNKEAQAARLYWKAWARGERFRRDPTIKDVANSMLNYGYTVARAYVARAIVASGLVPVVGIFHHNRGNPFCLADDLVEPLRPTVDLAVRDYAGAQGSLTPELKQVVVETLQTEVVWNGAVSPLEVVIPSYVASFAASVSSGVLAHFKLPLVIGSGDEGERVPVHVVDVYVRPTHSEKGGPTSILGVSKGLARRRIPRHAVFDIPSLLWDPRCDGASYCDGATSTSCQGSHSTSYLY